MEISLIWLACAFALVAVLYSSVGFGGGSSYTALLVMSGMSVMLVPVISLACNLVVTSIGTWKCWSAGLYSDAKVLPILALSVPAAFLGGLTPIGEKPLIIMLGAGLLLAGLQLALTSMVPTSHQAERTSSISTWIAPLIGTGVGYLSGIVGIGGGIFLSPILHLARWGPPRKIAALSSAYIAANSVAALLGKSLSLPSPLFHWEILSKWPLLLAVAAGSLIGHRLLLGRFPERVIKGLTAILVVTVAFRLLARAL